MHLHSHYIPLSRLCLKCGIQTGFGAEGSFILMVSTAAAAPAAATTSATAAPHTHNSTIHNNYSYHCRYYAVLSVFIHFFFFLHFCFIILVLFLFFKKIQKQSSCNLEWTLSIKHCRLTHNWPHRYLLYFFGSTACLYPKAEVVDFNGRCG